MSHEKLLEELMTEILGARFVFGKPEAPRTTVVGGVRVIPDGTIDENWIVELEARSLKQVRGSIVDLILTPKRPKKLLVLLAQPTQNVQQAEDHLNAVVVGLGQDSRNWCIVGLSRHHSRDEQLKTLRDRFNAAGVLTA